MKFASYLKRAVGAASGFASAESGNVAVMFAVAILPILGAIGAAVDYTRAVSARSAMQAALDSTALMLSQDATTLTAAQLNTKANDYFTALYANHPEVGNITITASYTANSGSGATVALTGSGSLSTDFMKVAGYPTVTINTTSTSTWGNTKLRVAMVLDNTGSMASSGKMTAMQTAAKNLIDKLSASASNAGDVYISIVPFSRNVSVAASNYTQNWMGFDREDGDWSREPKILVNSKPSNWSSIGPGSSCPFSNSSQGFRCTTGPTNGSTTTSSIPSSGSYSGYICPSIDNNTDSYYNGCYNSTPQTKQICTGGGCSCSGYSNCTCTGNGNSKVCSQTTGYDHAWIPNATSTWNGCITDRDQNYDIQSTAASSTNPATQFPADQYTQCPVSIMGLSYDWTSLKAKIDSMSPNGNTNQAIGLAWGWQTLLQGSPFPAPAESSGYNYNKVIILLSDGLNTQNRWTTSQSTIDTRQDTLCTNVKASGITIFTIQVNTGGDPTSTVLQNCASSTDKFFMLTSANQVISTFDTIGAQLSNLRISQ